jgi:hypothetical protein
MKSIFNFYIFLCGGFGVTVFLLPVIIHQRYQSIRWLKAEQNLKALFPSTINQH